MSILHDDNPEDSWNLMLTWYNLISIIFITNRNKRLVHHPFAQKPGTRFPWQTSHCCARAASCLRLGETAGRNREFEEVALRVNHLLLGIGHHWIRYFFWGWMVDSWVVSLRQVGMAPTTKMVISPNERHMLLLWLVIQTNRKTYVYVHVYCIVLYYIVYFIILIFYSVTIYHWPRVISDHPRQKWKKKKATNI